MIYADLPGMKKSEIKLTVKDRTVSLSAKRQSTGGDGRVYHRRERHQGTVSRWVCTEFLDFLKHHSDTFG